MTTTSAPGELPPRYPLVLLTLAAVLFTSSAQFLVVSPILPRIAEATGVAEARLGTIITAYAVAVGVFAFVAGPVSDHVGRRTVLRYGTAWMAVALLGHALATSFEALLAVRFLAGTASGFLGGAAMAYLGDVVPEHSRGAAMGFVSAGFAAGQVLGIPLGAVLANVVDYRAPFVGFGVLMVACSVACWTVLVPSPRATKPFRWADAFGGYRSFARRPEIVLLNVVSVVLMFSVSAFITYEPLWIETTYGVDGNAIALLFLLGGLANAGAGWYAGRLSDRIGRRGLVVGAGAGIGGLMLLTPLARSYAELLVIFVVTMGLVGVRISPLNAWVTSLVRAEHRGSLMALFLATGQVGFALGSGLAGPLYGAYGFAACAAVAGLGSMLASAMLLRVPERVRDEVLSAPG